MTPVEPPMRKSSDNLFTNERVSFETPSSDTTTADRMLYTLLIQALGKGGGNRPNSRITLTR